MAYKIGIDIGGTFTDLVRAQDGKLVGRHKSLTTPADLSIGVMNALTLAAAGAGRAPRDLLAETEVVVHGSTIATNAALERKGAKTGVICTKGTKYNLWKGEGRRQDVFNFKRHPPVPLVRPYLCLEVDERVWRDGKVLRQLDEDSVIRAAQQLKEWEVEGIAVCLLWSFANPIHERRV